MVHHAAPQEGIRFVSYWVPKSSRYDKHEDVKERAGVRCRDETALTDVFTC